MNNQPEPNRRQTLQMLLIAGGVGSTHTCVGRYWRGCGTERNRYPSGSCFADEV